MGYVRKLSADRSAGGSYSSRFVSIDQILSVFEAIKDKDKQSVIHSHACVRGHDCKLNDYER